MAKVFRRGDRVRLTDHAASVAMRGYMEIPRKIPTDWINRRGTVEHTPHKSSGCVVIKWDGLQTGDSWPKGAIERA